jgi:hypothetical protein
MPIAPDAVRIPDSYGHSTEFDVERYSRDPMWGECTSPSPRVGGADGTGAAAGGRRADLHHRHAYRSARRPRAGVDRAYL